jgi:amino acid permease
MDTLERNGVKDDTKVVNESARELERNNVETGEFKPLQLKLKSRHIQMIVIEGTVRYLLHI